MQVFSALCPYARLRHANCDLHSNQPERLPRSDCLTAIQSVRSTTGALLVGGRLPREKPWVSTRIETLPRRQHRRRNAPKVGLLDGRGEAIITLLAVRPRQEGSMPRCVQMLLVEDNPIDEALLREF